MLIFALSAAVFAVSLTTANAETPRNCNDREKVLGRLDDGYGETRQSYGIAGNNTLIEMFASVETGTWTILMTDTEGLTCIIASGQSFENTQQDLTPVKGELL